MLSRCDHCDHQFLLFFSGLFILTPVIHLVIEAVAGQVLNLILHFFLRSYFFVVVVLVLTLKHVQKKT